MSHAERRGIDPPLRGPAFTWTRGGLFFSFYPPRPLIHRPCYAPPPRAGAAAKRFKVTSTGKLLRHYAGKAHLLRKKRPQHLAKLRRVGAVDDAELDTYQKLLLVFPKCAAPLPSFFSRRADVAAVLCAHRSACVLAPTRRRK